MRHIHFYKTKNNRCPVEEFLNKLSDKEYEKVEWVFRLVRELDRVPREYFKKLQSTELWEIRMQTAGNSYRFLGFFDGQKLIVLNHAFQKKTQKTPRKEIDLAEQRRAEYLKRKK